MAVRAATAPSQDADHAPPPPLLMAKTDNARNLTCLLRAVQFREVGTCFVSGSGIKMTVEDAKCVQANAFIQAAMFQQYTYQGEAAIAFQINLAALIDCLSIFGGESHVALEMSYDGEGHPLRLLLEEDGVLTDCALLTQTPEETLDFDFTAANVTNKIILKAECLKETFAELDLTSDILEVLMSPLHPHFRLKTYGYAGNTQYDYPRNSDMIEVFDCNVTQTNRYKLSLLKPSTKALSQSSKVSLRQDKRGFLSLQFMIVLEDKQACFVEYLCVPEE